MSKSLPPELRRKLEREARKRGLEIPSQVAKISREAIWSPQAYPEGHPMHGQPHPQRIAFESEATIICYGGAAGGGKSSFGVGTALVEHHTVTIFRRQSVQLGDLIKHAKELTEGYRLGFNGTSNVMTLPEGASLEFAGLNEADDWQKWKGRRRDCWVFDEATECLRSQVFSLVGWLGSVRPGQRLRMILTFNPPTTTEGEWINELLAPWIDQEDPQKPIHPFAAKDGEIRYFIQVGDPKRPDSNRVEWVAGSEPVTLEREDGTLEELIPMSITFVRARVTDNQYLSGDDSYRRSLMALPEPLRSQALYGKWGAGKVADPYQVCPTAWVQAAMERWKPKSAMLAAGLLQPLCALGGDIAHGGDDQTVLAPRHDDWMDSLQVFPGVETPDGAAAAQKIFDFLGTVPDQEPQRLINIDALGYGANCLTKLVELGLTGVQSILGQQKSEWLPPDKDGRAPRPGSPGALRMRNIRAEMYWRLRLALDPERGATLALPPSQELLRDLCAARYEIQTGGVIKIEDKIEIKKRLGRSPDLADAVAESMMPKILDLSDIHAAPAIPQAGINRGDLRRQRPDRTATRW